MSAAPKRELGRVELLRTRANTVAVRNALDTRREALKAELAQIEETLARTTRVLDAVDKRIKAAEAPASKAGAAPAKAGGASRGGTPKRS